MNVNSSKLKCLVLGANGFIGSNLCQGLLNSGYSVRAFSRKASDSTLNLDHCELECFEGDFCKQADLEDALFGVDVVFHLVSCTLPKNSNDDPVYDVVSNVGGTLRLLEAMRKVGVKKLLFVSSGGTVYGSKSSSLIDESMPTHPICSYGVGKLAIENYLFMYRELYSFECMIFRLSNPYGVGRKLGRPQGAVNSFIASALSGKTIEIWGDGSVVRDYIYIDDVTNAFLCALNLNNWNGEVLNIGAGLGASLLDVVEKIETLIDSKVPVDFRAARAFDVPVNVLNIAKAKEILNWQPTVPLPGGIQMTKNWLAKIL